MRDFEPFWYFINERHAIYLRKTLLEGRTPKAGYDPSKAVVNRHRWTLDHLTEDPILHTWRFCNVFRELDRVTLWIDEHIRKPYANHEHLWFMLAIARTINWPLTLEMLIERVQAGEGTWPSSPYFDPKEMGAALDRWKEEGQKVYTGAYMIRAESNSNAEWYSWTKQQYIAQIVLGRLWEDRARWTCLGDAGTGPETLWYAHHLLQDYMGWGPFMAFQTVLEWRHTRYLAQAEDRSTWAAIGPGSKRGLNRLFGRAVEAPLPQAQALMEMEQLLNLSRKKLKKHVPPLEIEDIQNSLCETDKYLRVKSGNGGTPRSRYVPGRGY